jgi:hypothetical protein
MTRDSRQFPSTVLLMAVLASGLSSTVRAQTVNVSGNLDAATTGTFMLTGDRGFAFTTSLTLYESFPGVQACNFDPNHCVPGATVSLLGVTPDIAFGVTLDGVLYEANCADCHPFLDYRISGTVTLPPLAPSATATGAFTFSGTFSPFGGTQLPLAGSGVVTLTLHPNLAFPTSWHIDRATLNFDSPLPAAWFAVDIGGVGRVGSTSADASTGTWRVAGSGGDIWGTTDAFRFAFPWPAGNEVTARVESEECPDTYAKAGIMLRQTFDAGSPDVILDVRPDGTVEFMTRSVQSGPTAFLAGASATFPVWLKLTQDQGVSAWISQDGVAWQLVGTTRGVPVGLAGVVVTSHDIATVNHAVFSQVSVSRHTPSIPTPWLDSDLGDVGQPGSSMSTPLDARRFTLGGAGGDIWGTADAFHYVYQPIICHTDIYAEVTSLQNTHEFAKAGIMIRATTDPDAASVILDVKPDNSLEFMARTSPGASMSFIAGLGPSPMPVRLSLACVGSTITASISSGNTSMQVGSVVVPALASGGWAGLAVTSHDPSTLATATFDQVSVFDMFPPPLFPPWNSQDVGYTGLSGSAVMGNGSFFTLAGAGADIWGVADAFQFMFQPAGPQARISGRIVSEDGADGFAKAGVMMRNGVTADAAFAIVDVKPDGGLEFMARVVDGDAVQYLGGAQVGLGTMVRLERLDSTITASYSHDGSNWTTVGAVSVSFTLPAMEGFAVTSHHPRHLNTAIIDTVNVR